MPAEMLLAIKEEMDLQNQLTISHIVRDNLSFPKDQPPVPIGLRVISGMGRKSVRASSAVVIGQSVESGIGSSLDYMAAHEFGVPAHDVVAKGKALRFMIGERVIFRKKVHIPALPARAPIQRGIADRAGEYGQGISQAIVEAWKQ
jgi:hypothetical protein